MKKIFLILLLAGTLLVGCIKAPDDGMSLGEEVPVDSVNKSMAEAQTDTSDDQSYHVGDTGVIDSVETVYSSSRLKEADVYTVTSMDSQNYYITDFKVKSNVTNSYKMARTVKRTPRAEGQTSLWGKTLGKLFQLKVRLVSLLNKVSFQFSTAVGETQFVNSTNREMDIQDQEIQKSIQQKVIENGDLVPHSADDAGNDASRPAPGSAPPISHKFYGLKSFSHSVQINCGQNVPCKIHSTHIEFNQVESSGSQSLKIHWVYELSKEVPGLFTILGRCGSTLLTKGNAQIPIMECENVENYKIGS